MANKSNQGFWAWLTGSENEKKSASSKSGSHYNNENGRSLSEKRAEAGHKGGSAQHECRGRECTERSHDHKR